LTGPQKTVLDRGVDPSTAKAGDFGKSGSRDLRVSRFPDLNRGRTPRGGAYSDCDIRSQLAKGHPTHLGQNRLRCRLRGNRQCYGAIARKGFNL